MASNVNKTLGFLEFQRKNGKSPRKFMISNRETTLGSALTSDIRIVLKKPHFEEFECLFTADSNGATLENKSQHEIIYNGTKMRSVQVLKHNDVFTIDGNDIRYCNKTATGGQSVKRRQSAISAFKAHSKIPIIKKKINNNKRRSLSESKPKIPVSVRRSCMTGLQNKNRPPAFEWKSSASSNCIPAKSNVSIVAKNTPNFSTSVRKSLFLKNLNKSCKKSQANVSSELLEEVNELFKDGLKKTPPTRQLKRLRESTSLSGSVANRSKKRKCNENVLLLNSSPGVNNSSENESDMLKTPNTSNHFSFMDESTTSSDDSNAAAKLLKWLANTPSATKSLKETAEDEASVINISSDGDVSDTLESQIISPHLSSVKRQSSRKSILQTPTLIDPVGTKATPVIGSAKKSIAMMKTPKNSQRLSSVKRQSSRKSSLRTSTLIDPVETKSSNLNPKVRKLSTIMKIQKSPLNDLTDVRGVKALLKTPKIRNSPRKDLSDLKGVKKLLKTPRSQKSPKNDLSNIKGLKKIFSTPKIQNSPLNDLSNPRGMKKLLTTPKYQKSPKNDLSNVKGVKKLMKTPKLYKSPLNDLRSPKGLKKLFKLSKINKSPLNDLTNPKGIKKLLKTPKVLKSPNNDLTNVKGVREIFSTPKVQNCPMNDITNLSGINNLMVSPAVLEATPESSQKQQYSSTPFTMKLSPNRSNSNINRSVKKVLKDEIFDVSSIEKFDSTEEDLFNISDFSGVKEVLKTSEGGSQTQNEELHQENKDLQATRIKTPIQSPNTTLRVLNTTKIRNSPRNSIISRKSMSLLSTKRRSSKQSINNSLNQAANDVPELFQSEEVENLNSTNNKKINRLRSTRIQNSSKNRLSDFDTVEELLQTPTSMLNFEKEENITIPISERRASLRTSRIQDSPKTPLNNSNRVEELLHTSGQIRRYSTEQESINQTERENSNLNLKEKRDVRSEELINKSIDKKLRSPRIRNTPRKNLSNLEDVEESLQIPKETLRKGARSKSTSIVFETVLITENDNTNLANTPGKNNLANVQSETEVFKTPIQSSNKRRSSIKTSGIRSSSTEVFETVDNTNLANTPGKNNLANVQSETEVFKTPIQPSNKRRSSLKPFAIRNSPRNCLSDVDGAKELFQTSKISDQTLFSTPRSARKQNLKLVEMDETAQDVGDNNLEESKPDIGGSPMLSSLTNLRRSNRNLNNSTNDIAMLFESDKQEKVQTPLKIKNNENSSTRSSLIELTPHLESVAQKLKTPRRNSSRDCQEMEVGTPSHDELTKTSLSIRNQKKNNANIEDDTNKVLLKLQNEPRNDLSDVSGIAQLFNTPVQQLKAVSLVELQKTSRNSDFEGIKEMMATPKEAVVHNSSIRGSLSRQISKEAQTGLHEPNLDFVQEKLQNDLDVSGASQVVANLEQDTIQVPKKIIPFNSPDLIGVKELLSTPQKVGEITSNVKETVYSKPITSKRVRAKILQKEPRNDLSDVSGIEELFATEKKEQFAISLQLSMKSVPKAGKTVRFEKSLNNNLSGESNVENMVEETLEQPIKQEGEKRGRPTKKRAGRPVKSLVEQVSDDAATKQIRHEDDTETAGLTQIETKSTETAITANNAEIEIDKKIVSTRRRQRKAVTNAPADKDESEDVSKEPIVSRRGRSKKKDTSSVESLKTIDSEVAVSPAPENKRSTRLRSNKDVSDSNAIVTKIMTRTRNKHQIDLEILESPKPTRGRGKKQEENLKAAEIQSEENLGTPLEPANKRGKRIGNIKNNEDTVDCQSPKLRKRGKRQAKALSDVSNEEEQKKEDQNASDVGEDAKPVTRRRGKKINNVEHKNELPESAAEVMEKKTEVAKKPARSTRQKAKVELITNTLQSEESDNLNETDKPRRRGTRNRKENSTVESHESDIESKKPTRRKRGVKTEEKQIEEEEEQETKRQIGVRGQKNKQDTEANQKDLEINVEDVKKTSRRGLKRKSLEKVETNTYTRSTRRRK